jgi:hypothetical protein
MLRVEKLIYKYLCLAWLVYLVLRAIYVPLINDEGLTFYQYVHPGKYLPGEAVLDANNHILNTLLSIWSVSLFGVSSLALRLPNLLAGLLFVTFLYQFAKRFKHYTLRWGFVLSFLASAYFSEFFAYSRGYGISMALLIGMLWFIVLYFEKQRLRFYLLSLIFAFLAVTANLNILLPAIIAIAICSIFIFTRKPLNLKEPDFLLFLAFSLAGILGLGYFAAYGFSLNEKGLIYIGSDNGMFYGTIIPFAKLFFFGVKQPLILLLVYIFIAMIILGMFRIFRTRFMNFFAIENIALIFLLGNIGGIFLMGLLFGIKSPQDRAVLQFFPLFILFLFFMADNRVNLIAKISQIFYLTIPVFLLCISVPRLNLNHSYFFSYQSFPESFRTWLHGRTNYSGYPVVTAANVFMNPGYMFNNMRAGGQDASLHTEAYPADYTDFQVIDTLTNPGWNRYLKVVMHDKNTGFSLTKRKDPLVCIPVDSKQGLNTAGMVRDEGFLLREYAPDSLFENAVYIGFDLVLTAEAGYLPLQLVADILDADGVSHISFQSLNLCQFHYKYDHTRLRSGIVLPPIPGNTSIIKLYLYNPERVPYMLENGKVELFALRPRN